MRYWNRRKQVFGEQAFLRLSSGAAIQDDQAALRSNILKQLPNDVAGRAVFSFNVTRLSLLNANTRQSSVVSTRRCDAAMICCCMANSTNKVAAALLAFSYQTSRRLHCIFAMGP